MNGVVKTTVKCDDVQRSGYRWSLPGAAQTTHKFDHLREVTFGLQPFSAQNLWLELYHLLRPYLLSQQSSKEGRAENVRYYKAGSDHSRS